MNARSIFADLEEATEQRWHCDPRDKDPRSEEKRQLAFLRAARMLCPAVDIFAVPNAARRTRWEVAKAKREGLKKGRLDLVATWERTETTTGIAFLEFKNATEMPTIDQRETLNRLTRQKHHCGVFRQEESALRWLQRIGAPFVVRNWA